jgi:hypothetical protein
MYNISQTFDVTFKKKIFLFYLKSLIDNVPLVSKINISHNFHFQKSDRGFMQTVFLSPNSHPESLHTFQQSNICDTQPVKNEVK